MPKAKSENLILFSHEFAYGQVLKTIRFGDILNEDLFLEYFRHTNYSTPKNKPTDVMVHVNFYQEQFRITFINNAEAKYNHKG